MIARRIAGPQDHFERSGAQAHRDIRPFTAKLSEALRTSASGVVLASFATASYIVPAAVDVILPASVLYATWVLTRRVELPLRLPRSADRPDYSNPAPGTRKARMASGDFFLGWDLAGNELWVTPEDERQHMTIPGTTGAGKTTAILSLLANALARGSGFVLVDGKAQRDVFGKVLALARRFGREDDVRVLNFMVASGLKDSHRWNPFATGNADALRELLASQLGEQSSTDSNGIFRERAVALIGSIAPVLVWLRDHKGVQLNIEVIRASIELTWIWKVAKTKIVPLRDTETGKTSELDVNGQIPEDVIWPLLSYLGELPGYDSTVPLDAQKGDEPSKQHGFAQFYFTPTFTQLAVSLGHIFKVENGDIDMRDVVLNRRILVVNLPALENSDATLAALGKLVVSALRGMMAQLLGASLEGDYSEANKPCMGPSTFHIVLDEMAYYATSGLDRMLAMGRGLQIGFILGFQEVSGIWARLGEKTASLLGNANLTIAMRQQDSGRTREWLEKTAGQTNVTQATSYQGAYDGAYREARSAEVRTICRVDWQDLTSLVEGEAIVLLGGRRVYARVFHAVIDDTGPKRLGRSLAMRAPNEAAVRERIERLDRVLANLHGGKLNRTDGVTSESPVIMALLEGFNGAAKADLMAGTAACIAAGLAAIARLLEADLPRRPPAPADGTPVLTVSHMLRAATETTFSGPAAPMLPHEPVDSTLRRRIAGLEAKAGLSDADARDAASGLLGARDEAIDVVEIVEPPAMSVPAFELLLDQLIADIGSLLPRVEPGVGPRVTTQGPAASALAKRPDGAPHEAAPSAPVPSVVDSGSRFPDGIPSMGTLIHMRKGSDMRKLRKALLLFGLAAASIARSGLGHAQSPPGGSPTSDSASNIAPADTRSVIAPALPIPPVASSDLPVDYLADARTALERGRTGEAQEALERAETRLLDRSTSPEKLGAPDRRRVVLDIAVARTAIAERQTPIALRAVDDAIAIADVPAAPLETEASITSPPVPATIAHPETTYSPGPVDTFTLQAGHWELHGAKYRWVPPQTRLRLVEQRSSIPGRYEWRDGAWHWTPAHLD